MFNLARHADSLEMTIFSLGLSHGARHPTCFLVRESLPVYRHTLQKVSAGLTWLSSSTPTESPVSGYRCEHGEADHTLESSQIQNKNESGGGGGGVVDSSCLVPCDLSTVQIG